MKVRWTKESLRFRISPSELQMILEGTPVIERFGLSGGPGWEASIMPGAKTTELAWVGSVLQLDLAQADCVRLAAPDAEGVYFRREGGGPLRYFVEKDFPCVHPRVGDATEESSNTFEPPADFKSRKAADDE